MNGTSYLLALDGSDESRSAAYFAWDLAAQSGCRVVAQHVVDSDGAWRFLDHDLAGFVGSGVYIEAIERIKEALTAIGEAIMLSYTSQILGRNLEYKTYIDDGDPAREIARRAKEHDLVILGFHGRSRGSNQPRMFEELAKICSSPILVLRKTGKPWTRMQVCLTDEIADQKAVSDIYKFGTLLGIRTDVYLDKSITEGSESFTMGGWSPVFGVRSMKQGDMKEVIADAQGTTLLVVPSTAASDPDINLRGFLEQSDRRALLLWPTRSSVRKRRKLAS